MAAKVTSALSNQQSGLPGLCLSFAAHAPLPMAAVAGASHLVCYVNPAFCRLLEKPREELEGKSLGEMLPEKHKCVALLDRVFRTGKSEIHTEQRQTKPHPLFWSFSMWPVMADERPVGVMIQVTETAHIHEMTLAMNEALMLGSLRQHELTAAADAANVLLQAEIGERKQVETALQRAQAQLTDRAGQLEGLVAERTSELSGSNKQMETFVYSIAHDLRAPLRSMQGYATMLLEEAGAALSDTGKHYADRINKAAGFMDAMLSDLLAFSRISQERVELTSVKLEAVVASVLSRLQADIQAKQARVESSGPWPAVLAHEPTLVQVLSNLASNALKFVAPGIMPLIRLRAEVVEASERGSVGGGESVERGSVGVSEPEHAPPAPDAPRSTLHAPDAPTIRIWVEDNGPGIAPEHQEQIFRLFTRLNSEQYQGTGIGLAIVRKGIERMGGRVGVESVPGQGSRFWFELKQA